MPGMKRREFITLLGARRCVAVGGAGAAALDAGDRVPQRRFAGAFAYLVRAFRQGLSETGYVEGQNVAIEFRWADGQYDRLAALAADLVRHQVTVIAATTTPAASRQRRRPRRFPLSSLPTAIRCTRTCRQPEQTGRQYHGRDPLNAEVGPKRLELRMS